jgi:nicotinamidase-related amidase
MHTLVIVDMQHNFVATRNANLKRNVIREIKLSKKHNWPIIVLEFSNCRKTLSCIRSLLKNYHNCFYETKYENDGSKEVIHAINNRITSNNSKNIRVVGVETNFCVGDTAYSLACNNYKVSIVSNACRSAFLKTSFQQNKFIRTLTGIKIMYGRTITNQFHKGIKLPIRY